jgi:hypothetical protein
MVSFYHNVQLRIVFAIEISVYCFVVIIIGRPLYFSAKKSLTTKFCLYRPHPNTLAESVLIACIMLRNRKLVAVLIER